MMLRSSPLGWCWVIKMFLLLFMCFFSHLSCWSHCPLETSRTCSTTKPMNWICVFAFCYHPMYPYHCKGPQMFLLSFWPVLWKAALFCLDTDFEMVWVISYLSLCACLISPCSVGHSSQLCGLLFPSHKAYGVWERCFIGFHFRPSRSLSFYH